MRRSFRDLLEARWKKGKFLCVGLDSDKEQLPPVEWRPGQMAREWQFVFNKNIVDATHGSVCAFKPNFAFYASEGLDGLWVLEKTIAYIHDTYPAIPVILDLKAGEVEHSSRHLAKMAFDWFDADAVTVSPYFGREGALEPFLEREEKGIFILCRTSNRGGEEVQDFAHFFVEGGFASNPADIRHVKEELYVRIARLARQWNENGNVGLVAGATRPIDLVRVRAAAPDLPILVPGVGAQGGSVEAAVRAGCDEYGGGFILNASRSVIFASKEKDFARAAQREARRLQRKIRKALREVLREREQEKD